MFEELKAAWILEAYKSYKGVLIPSISSQLSTQGYYLDLDSLPLKPLSFKDIFLRWLIFVNKARIQKGLEVVATRELVLQCPVWKLVKCPIKSLKLTKEGMFNKPSRTTTSTVGTIGTVGTVGSINK